MMKFDPSSIYNRAVSKLQQNPDWKAITNNSVISALIKSNSEINAETARYMEYLFKESKYDTAQNPSSILSMANMLGYQPKRKISSTGKLWVSIDPRTHLIGKTISMEVLNEELKNSSNGGSYKWTPNPYGGLIINSSSVITDSKGNRYTAISTETLATGSYYTTIDIIQGSRKSVFIDIDTIRSTSTQSKLYPYLYIPVSITNCENASSISSRRFFKVYVVNSNSGGYELKEYRVVDNLLLSESQDRDVEVYNDIYNQEIFYLKFDNDPSMGSILDLSSDTSLQGIRVDYLESLGADGNIDNLYENFTITNSLTSSSIGFNYSNVKIYGVNSSFLIGGYDEEDISSIKKNATKFYISNYSVGTKESYENTVLNTVFKIDSLGEIRPKKVKVYGGLYLNESTGIKQPVTYISFISNNLEDISTSSMSNEQYNDIEESLNYYLGRLKSPQDTIKFAAPEYVALAFGIRCSVSSSLSTDGLNVIEEKIMSTVDSQWGPNSDFIDFGNSFAPSNLSTLIMNTYKEVSSVNVEVEAVKKLMWDRAQRIQAKGYSASVIHTMRVPFEFCPVFLGNQVYKGFKDHRVGSNYMFRMDVMYKKPVSLKTSTLNKSIFVAEPEERTSDGSGFWTMHDQDSIWNDRTNENYTDLIDEERIDSNCCYQVNFVSDVYTDNDFKDFQNRIEEGKESTRNSINDLGALDNYLIYFSGNYEEYSSNIGSGWVEFSFDAIYNMLQAFSVYDSSLSLNLAKCPLSMLKCDTGESLIFEKFTSLVSQYIDVYVSMRPIDSNLKLISSDLSEEILTSNNKSLLYVDSYDSYITSVNKENLTNIKKPRMISVNCTYEEV